MALTKDMHSMVERIWDGVWASGLTNPITASDLIATLLIASEDADSKAWHQILKTVEVDDCRELASLLSIVRRNSHIELGSEIEHEGFWETTEPVRRACYEIDKFRGTLRETDIIGDVYEHILNKLSMAGQFGQFRTPKHIIELMVEIAEPADGDVVLDPACGTGGFLIAASNYAKSRKREMKFIGLEIDKTISRIAVSNCHFHRLSGGEIKNADGLAASVPEANVILANPPFAGEVSESIIRDFQVKTKKSELLFIEQISRKILPGGKAVVVVPYGVLTGNSAASREIRENLIAGNKLEVVIELPNGVFRPYTDVRTAILFWKKEPSIDKTLMIRVSNDGFTLDQRRLPQNGSELGSVLAALRREDSDISHREVTTAEMMASNYSLSPSRYLRPEKTPRSELHARPMLATIRDDLTRALRSLEEIERLNID